MRKKFLVDAKVSMDIGSKIKAEKIVEALRLEAKSMSTLRFKVLLRRKGQKILIIFKSSDLSALRSSINSFCRWVNMLRNVLDTLE